MCLVSNERRIDRHVTLRSCLSRDNKLYVVQPEYREPLSVYEKSCTNSFHHLSVKSFVIFVQTYTDIARFD